MEENRRPIAVFDSGVGGISVLRALVKLMPNENYIYFGDSAHAPYGSKTLEEVRALTEMNVLHLLEAGAKAVVVACNTATSADISILRERYPHIPMIGIEPAVKPAAESGEHPRVLVMATPMTLEQEKFRILLHRYEEQAEIYPLPCPGLVEFVERGELTGAAVEARLRECLADCPTPDAVVLGCTHYPFLRPLIRQVLGRETELLDGAEGTARETKRRLAEAGLLRETQPGSVKMENSLGTAEILERSLYLLRAE